MTLWAVIPARPFESGKQRLAPVLSGADRARLNRDFFDHVLGVAGQVIRLNRCVVVSASAEVRDRAAAAGAHAVPDPVEDDLNAALTVGATFAASHGAGSILSLSCDLPLLTPADLDALIAGVAGAAVAIAPDAAGTGTNAMVVSPPGAIRYRYGPDSLDAHSRSATGLTCVIVHRPGLARDIDTPADLASWQGQAAPR